VDYVLLHLIVVGVHKLINVYLDILPLVSVLTCANNSGFSLFRNVLIPLEHLPMFPQSLHLLSNPKLPDLN